MEHYYKGNAFSLCGSTYEQSLAMIKKLKAADIEDIRQLGSFRPYVESRSDPQEVIRLLQDDEYFRDNLEPLLTDLYKYFNKFHCFVRLLHTLMKDLPKNLIGKQLRDVYSLCSSKDIFQTESFTDMWQLLSMLSKDDFVQTMNGAVDTLNQYKETFCANDIISHETCEIVDEVSLRISEYPNVPICRKPFRSFRSLNS